MVLCVTSESSSSCNLKLFLSPSGDGCVGEQGPRGLKGDRGQSGLTGKDGLPGIPGQKGKHIVVVFTSSNNI